MHRGRRITANSTRVTELDALIADKETRISNNAARIDELAVIIDDFTARIEALNPETQADRIAELTEIRTTRIASREAKITRNSELAALIQAHETRQTELTVRNTELAALITANETRITELEVRNTELTDLIDANALRQTELTQRNIELTTLRDGNVTRSGELTERNDVLTAQKEGFKAELALLEEQGCADSAANSGLAFLHSDHLGRPQFATSPTGDVIWDIGAEVTPFGDAVNLAGAFAQQLMFPGQYADVETGEDVVLSHNWHRTYDSTLGRYLQADPIGLAGGLNRYAYVGGNPVSLVDPAGLQSLTFDGETLSFDDGKGGPFPLSWPAVSGKPKPDSCQCEADQELPFTGPIPSGQYVVNPADTNRRRWYKRGWGPESAWGNVRTEITPKPGTNTFGRGGVNIHGGFYPGSAGCIDLTNKNEDFHKWLKQYGEPLDLNVRYRIIPSPRVKP